MSWRQQDPGTNHLFLILLTPRRRGQNRAARQGGHLNAGVIAKSTENLGESISLHLPTGPKNTHP